MSDTSPSAAIVPIRSDEGMLERLALVGFLAGYSGPTRDSYRTDLRLFTAWLAGRQVRLASTDRSCSTPTGSASTGTPPPGP